MAFSNSPLATVTILSPNNSGQRKNRIDRITPHVMEAQNSAEACGQYFANREVATSSNYGVGFDGSVGLYVEEENRSWCSSSADNDNRAVTVEIASDMAAPYAVRPAAWEKLIALCADVCQRNGKSRLLWIEDKNEALSRKLAEHEMLLTVHKWFIDTTCPGPWMMERMGELADAVTKRLNGEGADLPPGDTEPEPEQPPAQEGLQGASLFGLSNGEVIRIMAPLFTADQARSGILASVSLAQFCLETGYGQTELVRAANNGFGMKTYLSGNTWPGSTWTGERYTMETQEQRPDGSVYPITASFRAYPNLEASIADHSAYLLGAMEDDEVGEHLRYAGIRGCADYRKAAQIIQQGGYATALDYADWLCRIIEMWDLTQYDLPADPAPPEESPAGEQLAAWLSEIGQALEVAAERVQNIADAIRRKDG